MRSKVWSCVLGGVMCGGAWLSGACGANFSAGANSVGGGGSSGVGGAQPSNGGHSSVAGHAGAGHGGSGVAEAAGEAGAFEEGGGAGQSEAGTGGVGGAGGSSGAGLGGVGGLLGGGGMSGGGTGGGGMGGGGTGGGGMICAPSPNGWSGCQLNSCGACSLAAANYPFYFKNHPSCPVLASCSTTYTTCSAACPAPAQTDQCNGSPGQWQGCRGTGCYVCTELVANYPKYFTRHPNCTTNPGCEGVYGTCNSGCGAPTDADK
jgi:hypothetical protein